MSPKSRFNAWVSGAFDNRPRPNAGGRKKRRRDWSRWLLVETLEVRCLLSASTPTLSVVDNSGTYNSAAFPATDTVAGVGSLSTPAASLEGVTPRLSYYSGNSATGTALSGAPSAAGTYTVLASFAGSTDYTTGAASTTFTIAKANPSVTVTDYNGVFNGAAFTATDTVAGVANQSAPSASLESVTPSLTYYSGTSATGTALSGAPTALGTYAVLASFAGSADYTSASASTSFIIAAATSVTWTGAGDGTNWSNPANWSDDAVPNFSDNVTINLAGPVTVTVNTGTQEAHTVTTATGDALSVTGGSLTVDAASTLSGGLNMNGNGSDSFTARGGVTLGGTSTWNGGGLAGTFTGAAGATVTVTNSTGNLGVAVGGATLDFSGSELQLVGSMNLNLVDTATGNTLTNTGTMTIPTTDTATIYNPGTFNNEGTILVQGTAQLTMYTATLNNTSQGTIDFNGDGSMEVVNGAVFNNDGLTEKTAGTNTSTIGTCNNELGEFYAQTGTLTVNMAGNTGGTYRADGTSTLNLNFVDGSSSTGSVSFLANGTSNIYIGLATAPGSSTGTWTGTGTGTVLIGYGYLAIGAGGLTLDFPGTMLSCSGVNFNLATGNLTNQGTINFVTSGSGFYDGTLDNQGTIVENGATLGIGGPDGSTTSTLINELGASYLIESDQGISGSSVSVLDNYGTINKTAGTNTSTLSFGSAITNTGTIEASSGTLDVTNTGSFSGGGTFSAASGAAMLMGFGNLSGTLNVSGAGSVQLFEATSTGATFNVATGTTLNLTGGSETTLTGTYTATGGGTVAMTSGTLQIGAAGVTFNFEPGQFVWSGGYLGGAATVDNTGTITLKSTMPLGSGMVLDNTGTITATSGTDQIYSGGTATLLGGTLSSSGGSVLELDDNLTVGGVLTGSGTVQLGQIQVALGGLTLNFPGNTLQVVGNGAYGLAIGNLTNLGTMNLVSGDMLLNNDGTFYNYGSFVQNGGAFDLHSDNVSPTTFVNEPGATYLIEGNGGIGNASGGQTALDNYGLIRKTSGTGTSTLDINGPLTNTGTIEVDSGTMNLQVNSLAQLPSTTLTGGTWNALNGATLQFPNGSTIATNQANVTLDGAGAAITGLTALTTNTGSLTLSNGATLTTTGSLTNSGTITLAGSAAAGGALNVGGNFSQGSTGTLNIDVAGTSASGLFGTLTATGTATLGGALNATATGGYSPAIGQSYQVLTFASATGEFSSVRGSVFTQQLNATNLTLAVSADNIDLDATSVTANPTSVALGQSITVGWQVTNNSTTTATGPWIDSIYLSPTPTITGQSTLLGSATESNGAGGAKYTGQLTTALSSVLPGTYYLLVDVDSDYQIADPNRGNNILAAASQITVTAPTLTLGTATNGSFTAADQNRYYQVNVAAGGSLTVALNSSASSGETRLYVSQSTLPTTSGFQPIAISDSPNQTVTVATPAAGTYYILAYSVSGAAATASYTITATQSATLSVSSLGLTQAGNGGNATVPINGVNFTPTTTATLTMGGTTIDATAVDYVSSGQIYATFPLSGAATGSYTLAVQQGAQTVNASTPFQVVAAVSGGLEITLGTPQYVRSGRTGTIVINYTNPTNNDMVAPLLLIDSTSGPTFHPLTSSSPAVYFSTPDDPNLYGTTAQLLAVAPNGPAGVLQPGQTGQLTLTLLSEDTIDGDAIPVNVSQIESGQTIDWASQESALQPSTIPTAAWSAIFTNVLTMIGSTTDSYNAALASAATYLGEVGENPTEVSDVAALWTFLVSEANAEFPTTTLSSIVDASLPTPGSLSLEIDRTFNSTIAGRYTAGIFGLGWSTSLQMSLAVDSFGNVTIYSGGSVSYFESQPNGTYADADGEYGTLSQAGGVYTFTDTAGTHYVFLANGSISYEQDTDGNRITLDYNAENQPVTVTYSNPSDPSEPTEQLSLSFNAQGFVSQVADGTGDTWSYAYDGAGHLLSVTAPGNLTTSYTYNTGTNPQTENALLSITDPEGSQENFIYNAAGQIAGTSTNGGADAVTYSYRDQAEVVATDAAGGQTTVWFTGSGQPALIENPLGGIASFTYDNNGNLTGEIDPLGDSYQYTYDTNGNLTSEVNPLNQTTTAAYGPLDELTSLTDADGNATSYTYNGSGNLLSITYPDGTQQSFSYDPLGNMTDTIEQDGDPVAYQYNSQGLVTQQTFADGSTESYTYDAHGNLLTATDAGGTTTLSYNAANELLSVSYPGRDSLTFTYNAGGQRTTSVDQSGYKLTYTYDSEGRLTGLSDGSGMVVQYTYNSVGELSQKVNGNGTYTTYAYDGAGDLTSEINYASPTGPINSQFAYTYNLLGNVTSMTDGSGMTTYGYDAAGQLTNVTLPGGETIQYVYNAVGDRTQVVTGGTPTAYTSNTDNEITTVGSATYTYSANGNLASVTDGTGTTTYAYNDLNQLVSITAPGGAVTTFQYSPLGFMTGESVNGTQTNFLVDPTGIGSVVSTYNGSGSLIAHYNYGLGLVNQTGPSGAGYYDFDASGNTIGITGSSGAYVDQYSYLPFGETTTVSAALPNSFTFGGEYGALQLASNLFNLRNRDYTPAIGQFLSNDPIGFASGDTNTRRFVGNDPLNFGDPLGLGSIAVGISGYLPIAFFGVTLQVIVNDNGDVYYAYGYGVGTPGVTIVSVQQSEASEGNTLEITRTRGHHYVGATAHQSIPLSGQPLTPPTVSADAGEGVPGAGVMLVKTRKLGINVISKSLNPVFDFIVDTFAPPSTVVGSRPNPVIYNEDGHDPNALVGPTGYGSNNAIAATGTLPYTIEFENDGDAATQIVTVAEQLDPNLNWSTFQLGSFGFGPVTVTVPGGLTQYQQIISYQNPAGSSLEVAVMLDFNVQTGLLTGTFTSLDPATDQAPQGVFDGFLYPESQGVANSDGFVQYTAQLNSGLANATTIKQQASVVFDINAPLATNTASNSIDSVPPTSSVATLPARTSLTSIPVTWAGQDKTGGSGVAAYNIFVSVDGGSYTEWLTDTTETSANYTATLGHTYAFYSQAIDNVGNFQTLPTTANTSVVTTAHPWQNSANSLDVIGKGGAIVPLDALDVINYLNNTPPGTALPASLPVGSEYLDVNGTGIVIPDDALKIIDYLNNHAAPAAEPAVSPAVSPTVAPAVMSSSVGSAVRTDDSPTSYDAAIVRGAGGPDLVRTADPTWVPLPVQGSSPVVSPAVIASGQLTGPANNSTPGSSSASASVGIAPAGTPQSSVKSLSASASQSAQSRSPASAVDLLLSNPLLNWLDEV
jgi:RHS repeat-associated protein